jgi:molybdopterin molybdotransferase
MSKTRAPDWLSVHEATERILRATPAIGRENVPILHAARRVLAEPVTAPVDQPPWDNSAMDGYAVRGDDVASASRAAPAHVRLVESVPAGGFPSRPVQPGEAIKVMTGAPIPAGADSVIRIEHANVVADDVEIFDATDVRRNVRRRAEDLHAGATVLERGQLLRAGEVGVLATVGVKNVTVARKPRVAILSTGDELADLDQFEDVLSGHRIINSNTYSLAAAVQIAGGEPVLLGIARDNAASLGEKLEQARGKDILVTTAGASVGDHDLVKDVLEEIGFVLDFWRVTMKPGSPFSFGTLDGMPVFGLPGNPVSALVTFEVLVRPALRRMLGRTAVFAPTIKARAAQPLPAAGRLTHFVRGHLQAMDSGWQARTTGPQGSGILSSVALADALLVVPAGEGIEAGGDVVAIPIGSGDEAQPEMGF